VTEQQILKKRLQPKLKGTEMEKTIEIRIANNGDIHLQGYDRLSETLDRMISSLEEIKQMLVQAGDSHE